jgi:hypothetical protein
MNSLDHSRAEVAADARHDPCSCGVPPQMGHNEADTVRSARPLDKINVDGYKKKLLEKFIQQRQDKILILLGE